MRFIILILISFSAFSQDIFDLNHTTKYADYLLKSGQYELASKEYERLVYFDLNNDTYKSLLLKSYRLSNQTDLGLNRASNIFESFEGIPYPSAIELSKLYLTKRSWDQAETFWNINTSLTHDDKILLNTTRFIFENEFDKARNKLSELKNPENQLGVAYNSIVSQETDKKSPALAAAMSIVVPGLGKAYSKNWKDGLVSLFFTAGTAIQSYRSFNKHGIKNYRGWIYGGISFGFYLGNIYGSVKSTKDYNRKKINKLQHEASNSFNLYY
jgi:hypothetical protein